MSDPFTLLGLQRRPFLDEAAIRAAFQQRARQCHPDADGGSADEFSALNAAQALLSDPASRLQLLAGGAAPAGMPADGEFGFRVGAVLREADGVIAKMGVSRNAIERAMLARESAAVRKSLESLAGDLSQRFIAAVEKLCALDAAWPEAEAAALAGLGAEFRFLQRWRDQLRERELALSI
jgi:curved DNA-binding protein CbpA